jgi:hypothetical protein
MINMQSAFTTAMARVRSVTTLLAGQLKVKAREPESVHVVRTVMAGVAKAISVVAGHEIVVGTIERGNVTVITVGASSGTTVELMPVWYVVLLVKDPVLVRDSVPGSVIKLVSLGP